MQSDRLENLQILRAIAALLVTVAHASGTGAAFGIKTGQAPSNVYIDSFGAIGVDIFFVISGFIIARYSRKYEEGGVRSAGYFWLERCARIYPAYWLSLISFFAVCSWFLPAVVNVDQWRWFNSLTLAPSPTVPFWGLLLVTGWTLAFEMFFYSLVALALPIGRHYRWIVPSVIVSLVILGLGISDFTSTRFWANAIMLEFVAGWCLGLAINPSRHVLSCNGARDTALFSMLLVVIGVLAGASVTVDAPKVLSGTHDWLRALVWGVPAALLVLAFSHPQIVIQSKVQQWMMRLGDASYSIYLLHMTIIIAVGFAFAQLTLTSLAAFLVVTLSAICGLSLLFYNTLERPSYLAVRAALRKLLGD
jgi:exopolysaccharide production protein ExoZ